MLTHPPTFSVLGDSISTFQGYCPLGAEHYAPDTGAATGVFRVEDTWWMKVIQSLGGAYLSNQSISGNTISPAGTMGGFSPKRLQALTVEGRVPDHILLYAGLNDANFGIPLPVFAQEYRLLLERLQALYPQAQVHCGTLILGAIAGTTNSMACFVQRLVPYNEAIRTAAAAVGAHLVDLAATGARYTALDAFHPTREGMDQLASLWLAQMGPLAGAEKV